MFGDSGIKIASIIIGAIFIIGILVLANRFGGSLRERFQNTQVADTNITPTPSNESGFLTPTPDVPPAFAYVTGQTKGAVSNVNQIPDTGAEMLIIPALISLLGVGIKLRKAA